MTVLLFCIAQIAVFAIQLVLALFFLFVGGMKTAAPMAMLQLHHAWVASLPEPAARLVGISELFCAAAMILGLFLRRAVWWSGIAAWSLLANQVVAVIFHVARNEIAVSGPQNLLIVVALACVGVFRCAPLRHAKSGD
jgi:uncharacterized membrane protein YphA (DoxX/SURF4 family)